jgi:hypothetical protein
MQQNWKIGRDAMGVVFTRGPFIGRAVAAKAITSGVRESGDIAEALLRRGDIVTIYEMAESGGAPLSLGSISNISRSSWPASCRWV